MNEMMKAKARTDAELLTLAEDTLDGKVFFDWMVKEKEKNIIPNIFMVLSFISIDQAESLRKRNVVSVYEYYNKASSLAIDGYPMFSSCNYLTVDEKKRLLIFINKVKKGRDKLRNDILSRK